MNTRWVAARVLTRILQDGQSLTAALDVALLNIASSKDRAFIQALCYGVCRQFHRLDFILNQLLEKPIKDTDIKALALVGLYQLSFMRVKAHAAVSETVLATGKKSWAKSLINGLLRTYLREQQTLDHKALQIPVAALSHPNWLIKQIEQDWPQDASVICQANNQQPPMVLRVNQLKTSREHYLDLLTKQGFVAEANAFCDTAIKLEKPVVVDELPGFYEGLVSVQDTAAQLAPGLLNVQSGQRVLDVCAAPGGKTAHLLESQTRLQELIAVDIDPARLQRVHDNCRRLSLQATLITGDATKPQDWWDGKFFDRILLDAPCSATGVIRRHPDIKILRKPQDIEALRTTQKVILDAIWPLLAPGGLLLYATCSILKHENELQIQAFLTEHDDAVEKPIDADWGVARECGRQILTGASDMDGFYYALLKKTSW